MLIGYTIASISDEGKYYLVNGWNRTRRFWVKESRINKAIFKTIRDAKSSLTKLLKIMPEYKSNIFRICAIKDNEIIYLNEI